MLLVFAVRQKRRSLLRKSQDSQLMEVIIRAELKLVNRAKKAQVEMPNVVFLMCLCDIVKPSKEYAIHYSDVFIKFNKLFFGFKVKVFQHAGVAPEFLCVNHKDINSVG